MLRRRQADLCRQSRLARAGREAIRAIRFAQADIGDAREDARAVARVSAGRRHASGGREPCRPLDRRAGRLHPDQCRRHLRAARRRRSSYWRALRRRARRRPSASTTSRPTRCSARSAPEGLFTETTPYEPNSPYSASKAASDHLVRAWHHTYGLPIVLSNCSNNYGPYHFPEKLIPLMILNALEGKPLPVYGKGENVRDWLYVEDHARALLLVADDGQARRDLQRRRAQRDDATSTWSSAICALARRARARPAHRPARAPDQLSSTTARATTCATRSTPAKIAPRARLGAARDLRDRPAQDRRVVSRQPRLVGAHPLRRLSRRAPRSRRVIRHDRDPRRRTDRSARSCRDAAPNAAVPLVAASRGRSSTSPTPTRSPDALDATRPSAGGQRRRLHQGRPRRAGGRGGDARQCRRARRSSPRPAPGAAFRSSTSRPTTCSTAAKAGAYVEDDPIAPLGVYGRTQARRRGGGARRQRRAT